MAANFISFAFLWVSAYIFVQASRQPVIFEVTIICGTAQAIWLGEHLWSYFTTHAWRSR
jgi:hypothetical protein